MHCILTHNVESKALTDFRLGRHLTLVGAGVAGLRRRYAQRPLVGSLRVQRLKALIICIGQNADCEYMQVPLAYPRDLQKK